MRTEPQSEIAAEMAAQLGELYDRARRSGLWTLAYLIDVARIEAKAQARRGDEQS